jgi:hypothetical protein
MDWLAILRREVEADSQAGVARRLGYSPAVISQALAGSYKGNLAKVELAVLETFGEVACPWLDREISAAACRANRERPIPTSSAEQLRFWSACQSCTAWPGAHAHTSRGDLA